MTSTKILLDVPGHVVLMKRVHDSFFNLTLAEARNAFRPDQRHVVEIAVVRRYATGWIAELVGQPYIEIDRTRTAEGAVSAVLAAFKHGVDVTTPRRQAAPQH